MPELEFKPGFQGSETSGARVYMYRHLDDPILLEAPEEDLFNSDGTINSESRQSVQIIDRDSSVIKLVSVSVEKSMGAPSGLFTLKVESREDVLDLFLDDDWVDIEFFNHDEVEHVMRGSIDAITEDRKVNAEGATVRTYTITGRDFGKIWEEVPVFYARMIGDDEMGALIMRAVRDFESGTPSEMVDALLRRFLVQQNEFGRGIWNFPSGMPSIDYNNNSFAGNCFRVFQDIVVDPDTESLSSEVRNAFFPNRLAPSINRMNLDGQNLWGLAQAWSDPYFTELYADLAPTEEGRIKGSPVGTTRMQFVHRDKPFPTFEQPSGDVNDSLWYSLPIHDISAQDVMTSSLMKSGMERINTIFSYAKTRQENVKASEQIFIPTWNKFDTRQRGIRKLDAISDYFAENGVNLSQGEIFRNKLRDWYCLNPYMLSGTINLGIGKPEVRIGQRLRWWREKNEVINFYVEHVSHTWSLERGAKSTFGVTRGFKGNNERYQNYLRTARQSFQPAISINNASGGEIV